MENVFSSNGSETIQRKLEIFSKNSFSSLCGVEDLDFFFDIDKIFEWIQNRGFRKVALQFPDELLKYSIRVTARLKEKCSKDVIFFLLADTSYGSCCVDLVAAEHYQADSIIHFGHSCLSLVDKLPVFLVFEKYPLDLNHVENEINKIQKELGNSKLIILYDVGYYYLYNEMVSKFSNNPSIFMSNINTNINKNENQQEELTRNVLFSRNLPDDLKTESYSFYYIGSNEKFIHPFLFYFNKCKFYNFDPNKNVTELITKTSKELMKRYYLIEKARDAKIFGILIGTMSVANYNEAVDHVSLLLKKAKKRFYSFLIGKLNCPKLNNFMEVDMYVLISCNENCLVNSKELNKPVITIYELEIAYNCARLWGEEFICDYRQLLEGKEHYIPIELSDKEADVSLINGEMRLLADKKNSKLDSALVNRNDTLSMMHYEGAGEYLRNRTWTGLEQKLGETQVSKAIEGQKGIAATYSNEVN